MTVGERALQIWPVLALAAWNRQLLTYELLGDLIGVPSRGVGQCLAPIQSFCISKGLPPLTALVVHKDDGMPGIGFTAAAEVPAAQARVFAHDWLAERTPTVEDFG